MPPFTLIACPVSRAEACARHPHRRAGRKRHVGSIQRPGIGGETLPQYVANSWCGLGAPRGTPADIIALINREINAGLADPAVKQILPELGKLKNGTNEKAGRILGWAPRSTASSRSGPWPGRSDDGFARIWGQRGLERRLLYGGCSSLAPFAEQSGERPAVIRDLDQRGAARGTAPKGAFSEASDWPVGVRGPSSGEGRWPKGFLVGPAVRGKWISAPGRRARRACTEVV